MIKNLKNKKKKGFTLIELIIVIAVIAILAAVAIPKFGQVRKDAAWKTDIANAKTIASAATILMAEEKLTATTYTITNTSTDEISAYMQNPPSPKTKGFESEGYTVTISGDSVSVMIGTGKLFPLPDAAPPTPASVL